MNNTYTVTLVFVISKITCIRMPKRCALGCKIPPGVSYHQFPHMERNPERFKAWVQIVGGKLEAPSDYEYYKKKVICDIHFRDCDRNRNNRLNYMAIPTLHLHGVCSTQVSSVAAPVSHHSLTTISLPPSNESTETVAGVCSTQVSSLPAPVSHHSVTTVSLPPSKESTETVAGSKYMEFAPPLIREQLLTSRRKLKNLQSELHRLRKRSDNFKTRLASAKALTMDSAMQKITENMTLAAKIFTKMQCSQSHKKSKGRRFTLEEKVLSLSMYKKSPKCYTLLSSYFCLPSAKSLKRLLAQVEIESGLNKAVFIKMKDTVKHLARQERLCCLLFDEMSITPQLHYDAAKDKLRGFAWRSKSFADHVLVYMIKGIKRNFKQPVAYYFTHSLKKANLKEITLNVIKYVQGTGLTVLCTVCDQSTTNVSAINELIADTKKKYFQENKEWRHDIIDVGGKQIVPLFDVPHLLKGVRNNILTKDLKYYDFDEKVEKIIKWEYYQQVYAADKSYGELKLLQKLTEEHLNPQKIKKMKVKTAAQVFSHSVAVAAEHLTARGVCPVECRQIIKFTKVMDNLFDSLNSSTFYPCNGKIYKSCVKKNSPHHQLWIDALKMLKTIKFIKFKQNKDESIDCTVPSITNFIRTIEGIQYLWQILSEKYAFDAMLTRNFNQDPLENFFGNIRSYGIRNTAPNTINFEGAYKSLLLNNFNTPHSIKSNCENDNNDILHTLDFFLKRRSNVPNDEALLFQNPTNENYEIVVPQININCEPKDVGQANYVCGWVLGKCMKNVTKSCKICKKDMVGDKNATSNAYIKAKEYKIYSQYLVYPSKGMETCFIQLQEIVTGILKDNIPKNKIKDKIKMLADIMVEYPFTCDVHKDKLQIYFVNTVINVLLYSWCRTVNRILSGKIKYDGEDDIKVAAQVYHLKRMHNK